MILSDPLHGQGRELRTSDFNPARMRDVVGRLKISRHQNVYDADFEYGQQPLRWESLSFGSGSITHLPGQGGVRMRVTTASGDITVRQSRPYHRYQPGKAMFMSSAVLFGAALTNQRQRVGFFDDSNGVFFEQSDPTTANPTGMGVVVRSDSSGVATDTRLNISDWNCEPIMKSIIDWTRIQMLFIEYAWYGAGSVRWGVMVNGEPYILHQIGFGNRAGQTVAWCRTGNLPVRYEQRNIGAVSAQSDMIHYGVSVCVEGGIDDQRGFTYSPGMALGTPRRTVASNTTRFPVLSIRMRTMGTQEFTQASTNGAATGGSTTTLVAAAAAWTVNQWQGRMLHVPNAPLPTLSSGTSNASNQATLNYASAHGLQVGQIAQLSGVTPAGYNGAWFVVSIPSATQVVLQLATNPGIITVVGTGSYAAVARILSNTSTTLTIADLVTGNAMPAALTSGLNYTIGLVNRGQLLPRTLNISSSALAQLEIIASTPQSPVILTGANFQALSGLGSVNSFSERDVSATALVSGGEVVFKVTLPAGGSGLQDFDLSNLFPLFNTLRGNQPDFLTLAISTQAATPADVGADFVIQEAMS